jgi:hypothetical protein
MGKPAGAVVEYRAEREEDVGAIAALWNATFSDAPITPAQYRALTDHTAIVAVEGNRVIGAIPFQMRPLLVEPQVVARVAFAHAVNVTARRRGAGIGSGMMACARSVLAQHCDAMLVYTSDESDAPYTFYARTGHYDMHYAYCWTSAKSSAVVDADVTTLPAEAIYELEPALLEIFANTYGRMGGYWPHTEGYYRAVLDSVIYKQIPYRVSLHLLGPAAARSGYLILGAWGDELIVMEIATRGADVAVAEQLLRYAGALARQEGQKAIMEASPLHPFAPALRQTGWRTKGRAAQSRITAARVLRPEALAERRWRPDPLLDHVEVRAWTPTMEPITLHRVDSPRQVVTLEMKDEHLHRLLMGRLDLPAAFAGEVVTAHGGDASTCAAIARALPWCPWTYHAVEYI